MRTVEVSELAPDARRRLFAGLGLPHSAAVLTTRAPDGELVVGPLGHCVALPGPRATVAVTIAAVRDAGGEPALVRAAALASGELVVNLTTPDLAAHLTRIDALERDPETGETRWPIVPSARVGAPALRDCTARLECRVYEPGGPADPDRPTSPTPPSTPSSTQLRRVRPGDPRPGHVVLAEVLCVVADEALLDPRVPTEEPGRIPEVDTGRPPAPEFPWFLGPADATVVEGTVQGSAAGAVIDGRPALPPGRAHLPGETGRPGRPGG